MKFANLSLTLWALGLIGRSTMTCAFNKIESDDLAANHFHNYLRQSQPDVGTAAESYASTEQAETKTGLLDRNQRHLASGTATMIVDLTGLPQSVDIRTMDASNNVLNNINNKGGGGGPKTFVINDLTTKIKLVDSAATETYPISGCSTGTCDDPGPVTSKIVVDLSGLPTSVDVDLLTKDDHKFRDVENQGGATARREYTVLRANKYKVMLVDSAATETYTFFNCITGAIAGTCNNVDVTSKIAVDLSGLPTSVDVDLLTKDDHKFRDVENQGGVDAKREYTVLRANKYKVMLVDSAATETYTFFNCIAGAIAGTCNEVEVRSKIAVDLSGLPKSVDVDLLNDDGAHFRDVENQGGVDAKREYIVLRANKYKVKLVDSAASEIYTFLSCIAGAIAGTCNEVDVTSKIAMDLSGLPTSVDVDLLNSIGAKFRDVENQGGSDAKREYTVIRANKYKVKLVDSAATETYTVYGCGDGTCSPGSVRSAIYLNLGGLPTSVDVDLLNDDGAKFRDIENQGGVDAKREYTVLRAKKYKVKLFDSAATKIYAVYGCSDGTCSPGSVRSAIHLNLSGLPKSVDVDLLNDDGAKFRHVNNQGGVSAVRTYTVLRGNSYKVKLIDDDAIETYLADDFMCGVSEVTSVITADLTSEPQSADVDLLTDGGLKFRDVDNQGGGTTKKNYTVLRSDKYKFKLSTAVENKIVTGCDDRGGCEVPSS